MLSSVLQTISRHALFAAGDRVLVAVSGGPDSMALLAALWEIAPRLTLSLEVATVDHGLRSEAAAEAALVAERARALGLAWHALPVEVRRGGSRRGESREEGSREGEEGSRGGIQEAARRARLDALAAWATARGCTRVALGHQADDQAETVLFRIVRGTGLRGLASIPYRRDPFVRPLLDVSRAQILTYLGRRSLPFVTDPSNVDARFARARMRHSILPALRKENPRIDEALRRLAAEAARLPPAVQSSPEMAPARAAGIHVSARLGAALAEAARRGGTRSFDAEGGRRLTMAYGRLRVEPRGSTTVTSAVEGTRAPDDTCPMPGAGTYVLGPDAGIMLREERSPLPEDLSSNAACLPLLAAPGIHDRDNDNDQDDEAPRCWAWFDRDGLSFPLVLRRRRPGDRMRPRGGRGSRKLSDLFIDAKVPRHERARRLVVASAAGEVLFVPGLRPSAVGAPTPATRHLVGLAAFSRHDGPDMG